MKAVTIIASLWGVSKSVELLAGEDICFTAPGYHVGYEFNPPVDGEIYGIRLVHKEGSVTCKSSEPGSNWGCTNTGLNGDILGVQMVEVGGSTYYPTDVTDGVIATYPFNTCPNECTYTWYKMSNYGPNDNEVLLVDGDATYPVTITQEFSLQYGEGCCDTSTSDNNGESCADVYFLYNETTTTPSPTECEKGFDYIGTYDHVALARAACEARGQTLATLRDENDIALFRTYWEAEGLPYTGSWNGDGNAAIGLTDLDEEGVFKWDDGTSCETADDLCIDYWSVDEPNDNNGEDCATFAFPSDTNPAETYANDIWCTWPSVPWPNGLYTFCNVPCVDDDCNRFIYVDTPKSFEDAQAYCESEYGTSLAGVNEDDIPDANCVITDPGEPTWVGLYSETDPAFFEFVSGEECDIPFSGACVDFWGTMNKGKQAPQCLKEGGYQCAYYRESSELVYNNLDCEAEAPFLCEKYPVSSAAHNGLFNEIKDFVDDGVNGNYSDKKNFYFVVGTALLGLIVVIFTIFELIYCLCYAKKEKTKTIYDKLGSEHESEEAGVVKQDI